MNFFIDLVKTNSGTSSKRFISLFSLVLLTITFIADVFLGYEVGDIIYYTLSGLILGTSAMTLTTTKTNKPLSGEEKNILNES
jgi:hypothetical protein